MPSRMSCSLAITYVDADPLDDGAQDQRAGGDHVDPAGVHDRDARRARRGSWRAGGR